MVGGLFTSNVFVISSIGFPCNVGNDVIKLSVARATKRLEVIKVTPILTAYIRPLKPLVVSRWTVSRPALYTVGSLTLVVTNPIMKSVKTNGLSFP